MYTRILITVLIFCFASTGHADEPLKVQFAGFAYLGDSNAIKDNYPFTLAINTTLKSGMSLLDDTIRTQLNNSKQEHLDLQTGLGELDKGDSVSMALTLDHEIVSVEKIGRHYKLLVELGAQVLFFDFKEMTIIGSYPITVQYIDVLEQRPGQAEKQAIVKGLFTGQYNADLIAEFSNLLSDLKVSKKSGNHLQVNSVTIEDKALEHLPAYLANSNNAKSVFAQAFSKYLSQNQQVSVLPYSKGYAIGNKMAARFANGEVFNLQLPKATYNIDMTLRGFKRVVHDQTPSATSYLYGAYINLKVIEPVTGKEYLNSNFKNAATKVVPSSQTEVDNWPAYQETLLGLFDNFSNNLSKPSRRWAKQYAGNSAVVKQIRQFKDIVERCK